MKKNNSTLVVNLFGAPGSGKSTAALRVISDIKMRFGAEGLSAEYVSEYAKDLTWEGRFEELGDQLSVSKEQIRKERVLMDAGVDIIVTDGPVVNGDYFNRLYVKKEDQKQNTDLMYSHHNNTTHAINLFIDIDENIKFEEAGRTQTLKDSLNIQQAQKELLRSKGVDFKTIQNKKGQIEDISVLIEQQVEEMFGLHKENNSFYDNITERELELFRRNEAKVLIETGRPAEAVNILGLNDFELRELYKNKQKFIDSPELEVEDILAYSNLDEKYHRLSLTNIHPKEEFQYEYKEKGQHNSRGLVFREIPEAGKISIDDYKIISSIGKQESPSATLNLKAPKKTKSLSKQEFLKSKQTKQTLADVKNPHPTYRPL